MSPRVSATAMIPLHRLFSDILLTQMRLQALPPHLMSLLYKQQTAIPQLPALTSGEVTAEVVNNLRCWEGKGEGSAVSEHLSKHPYPNNLRATYILNNLHNKFKHCKKTFGWRWIDMKTIFIHTCSHLSMLFFNLEKYKPPKWIEGNRTLCMYF